MVGYNKSSAKLTQFDIALAGGGSGFITRMVSQPLDVLKIRFQLQVEPITRTNDSKYHSMRHAVHLIWKEEGTKAFWKGHVPAQLLSVKYGVGQFWTYHYLTKTLSEFQLPSGVTPIVNFSCGALAGCTATVISFPYDVVRTRLVAQSEQKKVYSGVYQAFKSILKHEGFLALFTGLWPTLVQIAPHAGTQFMCYTLFDNSYKKVFDSKSTTLWSSLISGSLSGLCAKTVVYPFDLAKKRMQVQGFESGRENFGIFFRCRGLKDCVVRIYELEGYKGLYKGLGPSLIKAVFATALHFSSYEMICQFLVSRKV